VDAGALSASGAGSDCLERKEGDDPEREGQRQPAVKME